MRCNGCGAENYVPAGKTIKCAYCDVPITSDVPFARSNSPVFESVEDREDVLEYFQGQGEADNKSRKNRTTVILLCIFLGFFGVHRYYTGNILIGLGQMFTSGGCGVWVLVDLILLLTKSYRDGEGKLVL